MKTKFNAISFLLFEIIFVFICNSKSFSQERKDEEIPKIIGPVASISNLDGWAKDDVGKWYEFNSINNGNRTQLLKIEISKIGYENKQYFCVAGFTKSFYIKNNIKHIEYCAFFWLPDSTNMRGLKDDDSSIHTRIFHNIVISEVIGHYQPVTWDDILIRIKKCFNEPSLNEADTTNEGATRILKERHKQSERKYLLTQNLNITYPPDIDSTYNPGNNFFIKYRYNYKQQKAQFFIGTLVALGPNYDENGRMHYDYDFNDAFLINFSYNPDDKDKNRNLERHYFEVTKNVFDKFFKGILE